MKKRLLMVYAGQSNMMGAGVYPPKSEIHTRDSFEYLHKNIRMGKVHGEFRPAGFPCGEFSYKDWEKAYESANPSTMDDYHTNMYFCPSMYTLKDEKERTENPCKIFSEAHPHPGAAMPPFVAENWEKKGGCCAYAHIAKGAVSILHYFGDDMLARFNAAAHQPREINDMCRGASAYFFQKSRDFFRDAAWQFPDEDQSEKCLVWLQGETDCHSGMDPHDYALLLSILWEECKKIGFTRFFMVRVGYFGDPEILNVMQGQEDFCLSTPDAYMMTRAYSFFPYAGRDESEWFIKAPGEEYQFCRDSHYGFVNQHVNEKGFQVIARALTENMDRLFLQNLSPVPEEEIVRGLIHEKKEEQ